MASNDDKKEHLLDNEVPLPNKNDTSSDNVNSPMQAVAGVMGNVLEWYVSTNLLILIRPVFRVCTIYIVRTTLESIALTLYSFH